MESVAAKISGIPGVPEPPATPIIGQQVTTGSGFISFTFDYNKKLEYSLKNADETGSPQAVKNSPYKIENLNDGKKYVFNLTATDPVNKMESVAAKISGIPGVPEPPATPIIGQQVTTGSGFISFTFDYNKKLEYSLKNADETGSPQAVKNSPYKIENLNDGKKYVFN
eukprot:895045_1